MHGNSNIKVDVKIIVKGVLNKQDMEVDLIFLVHEGVH